MTDEQFEALVDGLTRPIFIFRMARGDQRSPERSAMRIAKAKAEAEEVIARLFGPDLEDEHDR